MTEGGGVATTLAPYVRGFMWGSVSIVAVIAVRLGAGTMPDSVYREADDKWPGMYIGLCHPTRPCVQSCADVAADPNMDARAREAAELLCKTDGHAKIPVQCGCP